MENSYTCKVKDSKPVKNIQLFRSLETANQWGAIQKERGFNPVSIEENISIGAGMKHLADVSPQIHNGHYIQV